MKTELKDRVKALRGHYRLNQTQFGGYIGLTLLAVGKIETGETLNPQTKTIDNMVAVFGTTHEWLEKGKGEMLPNGTVELRAITEKDVANPWESLTYKELKETNSYLKNKLDEMTLMVTHLISKGGNLGKSKALELAALLHNVGRASRVRVNK